MQVTFTEMTLQFQSLFSHQYFRELRPFLKIQIWVQSLVRELRRSHKPHRHLKKKKNTHTQKSLQERFLDLQKLTSNLKWLSKIEDLCWVLWASLVAQTVKNLPATEETWVWSLSWEDSWRREGLPTPVFFPGEFHEQKSLVGYSPWGHRESDTTEFYGGLGFQNANPFVSIIFLSNVKGFIRPTSISCHACNLDRFTANHMRKMGSP